MEFTGKDEGPRTFEDANRRLEIENLNGRKLTRCTAGCGFSRRTHRRGRDSSDSPSSRVASDCCSDSESPPRPSTRNRADSRDQGGRRGDSRDRGYGGDRRGRGGRGDRRGRGGRGNRHQLDPTTLPSSNPRKPLEPPPFVRNLIKPSRSDPSLLTSYPDVWSNHMVRMPYHHQLVAVVVEIKKNLNGRKIIRWTAS